MSYADDISCSIMQNDSIIQNSETQNIEREFESRHIVLGVLGLLGAPTPSTMAGTRAMVVR